MIKKIYYKTIAIIFIVPSIAYAYLDPVTSLVIFQSIIAFIASVYGFIVLKPLRFIKKIFSGKIEKNKDINTEKSDSSQSEPDVKK